MSNAVEVGRFFDPDTGYGYVVFRMSEEEFGKYQEEELAVQVV